ncbi:hypothetical protein GQ53DRAFT_846106 [Thozetella sp. PMI_491]|nr:hypothetical protein GQ53DRAFT_846106 [Thozetella sp. PMI_491]
MATQQDLQELLRLLTVSRKVSMMQAMSQIKALQAVELRSIKQIAEAPLDTVEGAINDAKAAKLLQSACKAAVKRGDLGKRPAPGKAEPSGGAKRTKYSAGGRFMSGPVEMTPQELEGSLELPLCMDEELISQTSVQTNRAPLVLAFATELLRYTMPEQPLSSRLSLAQAVVSANSRSRAVNLGLEKGPSAGEDGWGEGQPKVRIMGREVTVLKRGGYEWRGEETVGDEQTANEDDVANQEPETVTQASSATLSSQVVQSSTSWAVSQPISLKDSTFIARAAIITEPGQRQSLFRVLLEQNPKLKTATHNAWAYRLRPSVGGPSRFREDSFDDGETGCGDLMLRIMRETDAVDTMVVLTRWFGGKLLGPDRWRLMRNCVTSALSERLRKTGAEIALGGEAVWGLDLEAMRSKTVVGGYGSGSQPHHITGVVGMQIHRPEGARNYLLKSFATAPQTIAEGSSSRAKKTIKAQDAEKEQNLGLLFGALRIVLDSWADHLTPSELDSRAWSWYIKVRPDVDAGVQGWGAKGALKLGNILALQRRESTKN